MHKLLFVLVALCGAIALPRSGTVTPNRQESSNYKDLRAAIATHDAVRVARLLEQKRPQGLEMAALLEGAIEREDAAVVRLLLENGADANHSVNGGAETPLMTAARVGSAEITAMLLRAGADPNGRGGLGKAAAFPLYYAVDYRHRRVVLTLLGAKANPNARLGVSSTPPSRDLKPGEGQTPLMVAVSQGDAEVVEWLLRSGADPWLVDENGRRAVDYLKDHEGRVEQLRTLLMQSGKR